MAGLVASTLVASSARASLVINLRFADGSTTHQLTAADVGTNIEIDVWATITGNNPPSANNFYGLNYVYYTAVSSLPDGPGTAVNGGIDASANALVAPFNNPFGSQLGVTQDVNGDGVADVGSSTQMLDMNKPRGSNIQTGGADGIFDNDPTAIENALPSGYEFEVEKIFFHVNSLADGETDFGAQVPTLSGFSPYVPANWFQDAPSPTTPSSGIQNGAYSGGIAVRLVAVPEPSSIAMMIGVWGITMRRRGRWNI